MAKRKTTDRKLTPRQKVAEEALWASPDMANLSGLAENLLAVPKAEFDALPKEPLKPRKTRSVSS